GSTLNDLAALASQFEAHGRAITEAATLVDNSNRRMEGSVAERRGVLNELVSTLESKSNDLEQRLTRFAGALDESLEGAAERAREIARLTVEATTGGAEAIAESFEAIRRNAEEERKRMADALHGIYQQGTEEANTLFTQAAERFADVIEGLKHMAAEMQQELEATRGELRRGILELPQETADS